MTQERLTCSKSAIKALEKGLKGHQRCPAIFIVDSEHILQVFVVFLLLL